MEKKKYISSEIEVTVFEEADVFLAASGDGYEDDPFGTSVPDFVTGNNG